MPIATSGHLIKQIQRYLIVSCCVMTVVLGGCKSLGKTLLKGSDTLQPMGPEPAVTFKALTGSEVPLDSLKGKVVLVNFWATWCEPCKEEIPWLIELQNKYSGKGFTMLGVAMDDEGASVVNPFIQTEQFDVNGQKSRMDYPIVIGNDDIAGKFGGIFGYPTSFLIDKNGQINKRIVGLVDKDQIDREVQKLLQGS